MRELAVCVGFDIAPYRRQIDAAAEAAGFTARYYPGAEALAPAIGDFEVIYGHPDPPCWGVPRACGGCAATSPGWSGTWTRVSGPIRAASSPTAPGPTAPRSQNIF